MKLKMLSVKYSKRFEYSFSVNLVSLTRCKVYEVKVVSKSGFARRYVNFTFQQTTVFCSNSFAKTQDEIGPIQMSP